MTKRRVCHSPVVAAVALIQAAVPAARATTYYVSPTGSDANAGTSPNNPWSSVAKVDGTAFNPGDQVLFQYGGQWNGTLFPASSGTAAAPITYAAYGTATLALPTFSGSDPIPASAFTPVAGTASTFRTATAAPVNWVFDNRAFTHEAQDATGSANPATDLAYVNATAGSFYYNPAVGSLYVNLGTASLAGHSVTAATRGDGILALAQSHLVFKNLAVTETAQDNAGYGIRVQNADNVQLVNCTATSTGKHAVGVINSTAFVANGLTATGSAPDQGFGGASAFVAYADSSRLATTSQWVNCTYNSPNGAYPAFISHGDAGSIASVALKNMVSLGGYGTGVEIQPTGPAEVATVTGGQFNGNVIQVDNNHSTVSGVTVTGAGGSIVVTGDHDTVSGNTIAGIVSNPFSGDDGGVVVAGTNATVSGNSFSLPTNYGPALGITIAGGGGTVVTGNTFQAAIALGLIYDGPTTALSSYKNSLSDGTYIEVGSVYDTQFVSVPQWQAMGYDVNSSTLLSGNTSLTGSGALSTGTGLGSSGTPFNGYAAVTTVPEPVGLAAAVLVTLVTARHRRAYR